MITLLRPDLIYPELSYKILGCAYRVHNELGGGLKENVYQKALASEFEMQSIKFVEQFPVPISYSGKTIMRKYCDYVVEDLIDVEIKSGGRLKYKDFKQAEEYLKILGLKLGLLIVFGREIVTHKRILNDTNGL